MKVIIYKTECNKAYSMYEQGNGASLRPWGKNTEYYQGSDDGGKNYILPAGYSLGYIQNGLQQAIFDEKDQHCDISNKNGRIMLISVNRMIEIKQQITPE